VTGLKAAIELAAENECAPGGRNTDVMASRAVLGAVELALFRIAQEALYIEKHSGPSTGRARVQRRWRRGLRSPTMTRLGAPG
jgi:signal transduction histidine kinase